MVQQHPNMVQPLVVPLILVQPFEFLHVVQSQVKLEVVNHDNICVENESSSSNNLDVFNGGVPMKSDYLVDMPSLEVLLQLSIVCRIYNN